MTTSTSKTRTFRIKPLLCAAALLTSVLTTAGLAARQQEGPARGTTPNYPLASTVHPPLPGDLSLYWFVPDATTRPGAGRPDPAAAARLARGAQLVAAKDYAAALPLLSPTSLNGTPLENYAAYYVGVAQIGLARYDQALLVLSLLAAKPLDGVLKELVPLRMGEAALALATPDRAEGALVELSADKLAAPGAVWLMRARVEDAANHRAHALEAYRRLYYDYPLTAEAADAPAALSRLQAAGEVSAETDRALARAERLFAARRWADARNAFVALQSGVSGNARDGVALRIAQCDYYLNSRRAAREALATMFDGPRAAEARYFHLLATKALDRTAVEPLARKLVAEYPDTPWAEQALNELATQLVTQDQDDEADAVFRQLMRAYPKSPYAERAAWKVGWRAYRGGDFQETIRDLRVGGVQLPARRYPAGLALLGGARPRALERQRRGERTLPPGGGGLPELLLRPAGVGHPESEEGDAGAGAHRRGDAGDVDRRGRADGRDHPDAGRRRPLRRGASRSGVCAGGLRRLAAAPGHLGVDPPSAGLHADGRGALRGAARRHHQMRRAYPQFMAAGGEALPPDVLRVIFPLDYWPLITKYSDQHKLDRYLIAALMAQESTFTAEIRSYANAYGLMQIIPSTGRIYARKLGIKPFTTAMLRQPEINVRIGTQYFKDLVDRFGGAHYALASYNAGEGRVARWDKETPGIPQDEFIDDIPYPQTQGYVKRILGTAEDYRYVYGSGLVDPNAPPTVARAALGKRAPLELA